MRYFSILFFIGFSAAQSLVPGVPLERIAVDGSGNIYVAQFAYIVPSPLAAPVSSTITKLNQWTAKVPFPVTSLSVGAKVVAAGPSSIAMLDPGSGSVLSTSPMNTPAGVAPQWVAVTAVGNVVISGEIAPAMVGTTFATSGALNIPGQETYLMKLDPTGKMLWAAQGIGGPLTVDSGENIYVAGSGFVGSFPTTANAFQATASFSFCAGGGGITAPAFPCPQQYIAKVSPDGSSLLFSTYLTGMLGASPADIELGPDGSIYTAGSVQATDYPVTSGALIGAMPAKFDNTLCECMLPIFGYARSGYVSRISADGSKLLYSTYLGGSQQDNATAIGVGADGSMVVGGVSSSPDFPGLPPQLGDCEPGNSLLGTKSREFLALISGDGSKITNAQLIGGTNPGAGIACITDAADGAFADAVSPGQLITINGIGVGPAVSEAPGIGDPAMQIGGVSVMFDGIPAGLTAAGGSIVTAAVPFAVAGKQLTTMTLMQNGQAFDSRQLYVAGETPSLFVLAPNGKACNTLPQVAYGAFTGGSPTPSPMVLNADGTINACDNPAAEGSAVTFFVNGTGIGTPPLMINSGSLSIFSQTAIGVQTSVNAVSVLVPPGSSNPLYVYYVSEGNTAAPDYRIAFGMPVYVK